MVWSSAVYTPMVVNMVGHQIVKKALEHGFVHPEAVLMIEGIPHAQIIKI